MATNRFYRPQRGNYISQYADYKLPYAAVQNAVLQRQQRFDQNQQMLANAANKFGQIDSRAIDAPGKNKMIGDYLDEVNSMVNEKFGGDFSLAAGDIYDRTARMMANPAWAAMQRALEDEKQFKAAEAQAKLNEVNIHKTKDWSGDRSVFAEDGSIQNADYSKYIAASPQKYKTFLEDFFKDKPLDKNSGLTAKKLAELNAAAKAGNDTFAAYWEREYRNFDDEYISNALNQYKNANPAQYQIYKDLEARGDSELTADQMAMRDLSSAAMEYAVDRNTAKMVQVQKLSDGKSNTTSPPALDLLGQRPGGLLTREDGSSYDNYEEVQKLETNEEASPRDREIASQMTQMADAQIDNPNDPRYEIVRQREAEADAWDAKWMPTITENYSRDIVANTFGEGNFEKNYQVVQELLNAKLNPDNTYKGGSPVGTFIEGLGKGLASGAFAMTDTDRLKAFGKIVEGYEEAKQEEILQGLSYDGNDPTVAARQLSRALGKMKPEDLNKLGIETSEVKNNPGVLNSSSDMFQYTDESGNQSALSLTEMGEKRNQIKSLATKARREARDQVIVENNSIANDLVYMKDPTGKHTKSIQNTLQDVSMDALVTKDDITSQLDLKAGWDDDAYKAIMKELQKLKAGDLGEFIKERSKQTGNVELYLPARLIPGIKENPSGRQDLKIPLETFPGLQNDINKLYGAIPEMGQYNLDMSAMLAENAGNIPGLTSRLDKIPTGEVREDADGNVMPIYQFGSFLAEGKNGKGKILTYGELADKFAEANNGIIPEELERILEAPVPEGSRDPANEPVPISLDGVSINSLVAKYILGLQDEQAQ